jgi:hypothetical protein
VIIDTEGNPTDDDFKDLATNGDLLVISAVPESVRNGRSDSHARKEMSCGQTHFLLRGCESKAHLVALTAFCRNFSKGLVRRRV